MPASNWFWIIYVMIFVFGGFFGYRDPAVKPYFWPGFIVFVLLGLIGFAVFGSPVTGGAR